jgi:hypothetical protein
MFDDNKTLNPSDIEDNDKSIRMQYQKKNNLQILPYGRGRLTNILDRNSCHL